MEEASLPLCGCGGWIHRRHGTPFIRRISLLSDGVGVDAIDDEVGDRRSMLLTAEKDIFGEFAGKFFLYQGKSYTNFYQIRGFIWAGYRATVASPI
jgi:hypothetical protein